MNRKSMMVWVALPILMIFFYGCPKKKPVSKPDDLNVETTTVPETPSQTTTDVQQPADTAPMDQTEVDPLQSADLQVVNEELKRRGFSPDIYFDYDESVLSDDTRDRLSRNAEVLRSQPSFLLTIEGHADERGTNEYNLALGDRRANGVKSYMTSLGLPEARLRTVSYGEERPACTETVESCWSQNRRAHMTITGRSGQ
jgi:peptidoglycan-associated lipoprotein